jgi:hypothetical protein
MKRRNLLWHHLLNRRFHFQLSVYLDHYKVYSFNKISSWDKRWVINLIISQFSTTLLISQADHLTRPQIRISLNLLHSKRINNTFQKYLKTKETSIKIQFTSRNSKLVPFRRVTNILTSLIKATIWNPEIKLQVFIKININSRLILDFNEIKSNKNIDF